MTEAANRIDLCEPCDVKYAGSGEAAEAVGVSVATLLRWARAGLITPADRTLGGHYRWDIDDLKRQLDERKRELETPPDTS